MGVCLKIYFLYKNQHLYFTIYLQSSRFINVIIQLVTETQREYLYAWEKIQGVCSLQEYCSESIDDRY